ncbi:chromosome segregation protein SMC [Agilicoccus flavus]|uniref:chromosome segregation protein SMC n=1 Tax=Agilicoccus flavus TaxID=2775968 RepID=UPI001CF6C574|nr:chromosome segregation protein SMC [Agilicoccus flavus]
MYVKSLTLRGFKSFASATHLRLEPGITCIVGPNGSGKSNVVDALAWVMGEQGAKTLRGGKMEDVIFAGTSGRPPLGRAEVTMTIDNTDGALPIDYAEVTISRTMFRTGGSEYAINGTGCRLLDIQELLSDSGIGREMHVIVGQGQLDAVLRATPEERRGFIEEAAGVLKHRKRKERALRKLEQMEGNLTRVADLTTEIRRQLGPLGRQAETARQAGVIQADVRDARLRLLADDLAQLTSTLEQEVADESALLARRAEVEGELTEVRKRLRTLEAGAAQASAAVSAAQQRWYDLSALRDRLTSVGQLAAERVRLLADDDRDEPATPRRDPDALRAQAAQVRADEDELRGRIEGLAETLARAVAEREEIEGAARAERERLARLARAAADRREGLARLAGQVAAQRSRVEAGEAEIGRLREAIETAERRASTAESEFARLEASVADEEEGEEGLDSAYEESAAAAERARAQVEELVAAGRTAEGERTNAHARREALELSLRRKDGGETLLAQGGAGLLGTVPSLLSVESGHEAALAAALGWASDAVVVDSLATGTDALRRLREDDGGRVGLLVAAGPAGPAAVSEHSGPIPDRSTDGFPAGARWAVDVVSCGAGLDAAVGRLLAGVVLVADDDAARALLDARPELTAVTAAGDVVSAHLLRGGSAGAPSLIEITSAVEEAAAAEADATARGERIRFALNAAREEATRLEERAEAALSDLHVSDARMSAVAEALGRLSAEVGGARAEAERGRAAMTTAQDSLEASRAELGRLEDRLAQAQGDTDDTDETSRTEKPDASERDRLEDAAQAARAAETEARLTLRTREERLRAMSGRADSLEGQARAEVAAREKARARAERRARSSRTATAVRDIAERGARRVAASVEVAAERRARSEAERATHDADLAAARTAVDALAEKLRELTDTAHRDEVARTQQRLRIEALQARALDELGVDPEVLVDEYGPHRPIPPVPDPALSQEEAEALEAVPFVRVDQEKRLKRAERRLAQLGRINPLALEEFAALEERHTFLVEQLDDLRRSKKDLLDIVAEVDERVQRAFAEAYVDTAAQFEGVFSRLFPGGEGRLTLTDPDNMLTTGIEVEARPPGKKIKRLSLLSGGERSLTAVALLVSIFKARPSPFYIMDEVEAALDDTNLGRLITLFEELRDSSQLIVITHQKRTMEVADALYGVTMRGDGVTTVVSQRIREAQSA